MADTSSTTQDPAQLVQILSLLLQSMGGKNNGSQNNGSSDSKSTSKPSSGNPAGSTVNNPLNEIPTANASDQELMDWWGQNQGKTIYDSNGNPSTIPGPTPASNQGMSYGMATPPGVNAGGAPSAGDIRGWISADGGILNGASFQNPLIAQAEKILQDYQSGQASSPNANSTLVLRPATTSPAVSPSVPVVPVAPAAAPSPPSVPPPPPAALPQAAPVPVAPINTTVPANNPQLVTDMIGANANQAMANPNLMASSGLSSGNQMSAGSSNSSNPFANSIFSRLNSGNYAQQTQNQNSMNLNSGGASGGGYNVPSNLGGGYIGASPGDGQSGYMYPSQSAATANGDVGAGVDGGVAGAAGGLTGSQQAQGIGSSIGALITSLGKMFTPGVPGIPQIPQSPPLSQFRPAVMT